MAETTSKENGTSTFLRKLFSAPDLKQFFLKNEAQMGMPSFSTYISDLCRTMQKIPEQVIKSAGIERTFGHQLFNGTRRPSRDKAIQLAFGLGLDPDGTQELLKIARKNALYPKIKRDAAILYCIKYQKDFFETQSILEELNLTLLGRK